MSRTKKFADQVLGVSDQSTGDERERDVVLRAYTVAWQAGVTVLFCFSLVLMAFGESTWSLVLVLLTGATSWVAVWYAGHEGVNLMELIGRSSPRRGRLTMVATLGFLVLWMGLYAVLLVTGSPIVSADVNPSFEGREDGIGSVMGGVTGAALALIAAALIAKWMRARARRREAEAEDED